MQPRATISVPFKKKKKEPDLFLVWICCFLIKGNRLPPPCGRTELPGQTGWQELFNAPSRQAVMFN